MTDMRKALLDQIVDRIEDLPRDHVRRVAVDGTTASGKSTLADEITAELERRGVAVERLTMDGYHNPRKIRYRKGRMSPVGYFEDAYDFDAFVTHALGPLGPGGSGSYLPQILDLAEDEYVDRQSISPASDAVLIVDGSFLQRPQLEGFWDFVIFVDTQLEIARQRGIDRDHEQLGGRVKAAEMYDERYQPAARRYLLTHQPADSADLRVVNNDFESPELVTKSVEPTNATELDQAVEGGCR